MQHARYLASKIPHVPLLLGRKEGGGGGVWDGQLRFSPASPKPVRVNRPNPSDCKHRAASNKHGYQAWGTKHGHCVSISNGVEYIVSAWYRAEKHAINGRNNVEIAAPRGRAPVRPRRRGVRHVIAMGGLEECGEPLLIRLAEQPVGLIDHQELHVLEREPGGVVDVVHKPPGGRDEDIGERFDPGPAVVAALTDQHGLMTRIGTASDHKSQSASDKHGQYIEYVHTAR